MKTFSKFLSLISLVLCLTHITWMEATCSNNVNTYNSFSNEYSEVLDKIYIQPFQLEITDEGIFILIQDEKVLVRQLSCDENGIYFQTEHLDTITDKCKNGHKIWCGRCGGCAVRWCKFRCKCVEWESK